MPKKTFEQAMKQLEKIVQELEAGDLPLEKAMSKFEEGIQLSRFCSKKLDETQEKINVLLQDKTDNGVVNATPFETDDEPEKE